MKRAHPIESLLIGVGGATLGAFAIGSVLIALAQFI